MPTQLYVNKPGGVVFHLQDGTSEAVNYGDPVPDNVADYVDVSQFADSQQRKPGVDGQAQLLKDSQERTALAEAGQPNSSSSPVPGNYTELDEDAAAQFVASLAGQPQSQAAVLVHEIAYGGNRQVVVDAAGDYAKAAAGVLIGQLPEGAQEHGPVGGLSEAPLPSGFDPSNPEESVARIQAAADAKAEGLRAAGTPPPSSGSGDELTGADLDARVEALGIDASQGGSKSDGSLTADEKRSAVAAKEAEAS